MMACKDKNLNKTVQDKNGGLHMQDHDTQVTKLHV